ncbi:MAG: hypothetical protein [Microviridae sp.]|nr:MAG: hypothetical protein [Microviridae sp.]
MKAEKSESAKYAEPTTKQPSNSSELFEQKPIKDTPFTAVRMDDKWFLTMGKYRLSEPIETLEQCEESANDASWMRILQVINIMIKEDKNGTLN